MPPTFRSLAAAALRVVRRWPLVHAGVHRIALLMMKTRWGKRFVRDVIVPGEQTDAEYRAWVAAYDTLSDADREAISGHISRMARRPLISVVMAAGGSEAALLRESVSSLKTQLYPHWELCVAGDASAWPVLEELAAGEPRIRLVRRNGESPVAAANAALVPASGEFAAFLGPHDRLSERALYEIAAELDLHPDADLVFSDEDEIDEAGQRARAHHKTGWNPELMLATDAVGRLAVVRRKLLAGLGGLREGFDGAEHHDLALRVGERTAPERIRHVPWVLYHRRRPAKTEPRDAAERVVRDHLARTGQAAEVEPAERGLRIRRALPSPTPLVSVIVPTRDRADLLGRCVDGVLRQTAYEALELLIVDNGSVEPATLALFDHAKADPRVRILPAPGPFNFAALMNRAVAEARGEVVALLNNDISMIDDGWLAVLVAQAVRPTVGAVGAKLLYPDDSIQHAGVVLGVGPERVAGHLYVGVSAKHAGYRDHLLVARNVSAVTAACLAMRKAVYRQVGGMDAEALPVAFNDVDLCLRVRAAGYDIVWTPDACLDHHESASRGSDMAPEAAARYAREVAVMRERWGPVLDADPFYGPVFDRRYTTYGLGEPPERTPPWFRGR